MRLVAKPGFEKMNPVIEMHLIEIQDIDSDPSFFQDLGFQGIYIEREREKEMPYLEDHPS